MTPRPVNEGTSLRLAGRLALFAVALGLAAALVHAFGLNDVLHKEWIDVHVKGRGLAGIALLVAVTALATAVGCPRQIPSFLAGYALGTALGGASALAGTAAGAALTYGYGRIFGGRAVDGLLGKRLKKAREFLVAEPFRATLVIRLLPIGSNVLTSLAAGAMKIPALRFLAGSTIGFIPQTLIFALVGKGFRVDPLWRVGVGILLLVVSAWMSQRLYRRYRRDWALAPSPPSSAVEGDEAESAPLTVSRTS